MKTAAGFIGLVAVAALGVLAVAAERPVQTEPLKTPPAWLKEIPYRIVYETFPRRQLGTLLHQGRRVRPGEPDEHAGRQRDVPARLARRHEGLLRRQHRQGRGPPPQRLVHEHGRHRPQEGGRRCPRGLLERRRHGPGHPAARSSPTGTSTRTGPAKAWSFYDLATGKTTPHPNKDLFHLYNMCCSPDNKWFVTTVHGGMGFDHAIAGLRWPAARSSTWAWRVPAGLLSPTASTCAWGSERFPPWHRRHRPGGRQGVGPATPARSSRAPSR